MLTRKKVLTVILLGAFTTTFLFGYHFPFSRSPNESNESDSIAPVKHVNWGKTYSKMDSGNKIPESRGSMLSFQKRLQGKVSQATLDELFDEAFDPDHYLEYLTEKKRGLIIQKWGELAPMQGLKKLEEQEGGIDYLPSLFAGWASKDPKGALAFYAEHYKGNSVHSASILNAVIGEYALQSPAEAWESITAHEDILPRHLVSKIKQRSLLAAARTHPEMIPEVIEKLGTYTETIKPDGMGNILYQLGTQWGSYDHTSRDWIENLPEELKAQAEAGRIMGITKGNVKQVHEYLQQLPQEERTKTALGLVPSFFYAGLDTIERATLLADYDCLENFGTSFRYWLSWDQENAKKWIHSLPEGEQKNKLIESQKEAEQRIRMMDHL